MSPNWEESVQEGEVKQQEQQVVVLIGKSFYNHN